MIELIIAITIFAILWGLRKAWYAQSNIFNERVELKVKEQEVDLQEDYLALSKAITERKEQSNGKWYDMKDIDEAMKSDVSS